MFHIQKHGYVSERVDSPAECNHAYRGFGGFGSFVAHFSSGYAFKCLLLCVDGKYAEYHRYVAVGIKGGDALRYALADIVEVGSVATHYTSDGDDCVKQARFYQLRGGKRQFDGSGDIEHDHVVGSESVGDERIVCAAGERAGDVAVPLGAHYGYAGILDARKGCGGCCG